MKSDKTFTLHFKIILVLLPLLWFGTAWLFGRFHKKVFIPGKPENYSFYAYSDSKDHKEGKSGILAFSFDSTRLFCQFQLDSGFAFPYAGISVNRKKGGFMNFALFNRLHLEIATEEPLPLQISLITHEADFSRDNDALSNRYNTSLLHLKKGVEVRDLPFGTFRTPQWWYEHWQKQTIDFPEQPDYSKTVSIVLQSSPFTTMKVPVSFEILEMHLWHEMTGTYRILLVVTAFYYLLIGVWHLSRMYHADRTVARIIGYEKLLVSNHEDEEIRKIIDYIGTNYAEPDLTLDSVTRNTGVSSHRISQLLNARFNKDFKQYLQEIRLCEAHRLLRETDHQVTEIAGMVGFNYLSSFTRSFKNFYKKTPKEVRREF